MDLLRNQDTWEQMEALEKIQAEMARPLKEKVADNREMATHDVNKIFLPVLEAPMKEFVKSQTEKSVFPAIDIGSGYASHVVYLALHYQLPVAPTLEWYASDWKMSPEHSVVDNETRAGLKCWLQESIESTENPLSIDKNSEPIYKGDWVELSGLQSTLYNGKRGTAIGSDPNASERLAVQLAGKDGAVARKDGAVKSFRTENVSYLGELSLPDASLRHLKKSGQHKNFFQGLVDRSREINILKSETWSNVEELEASCALITCTCLLSCLGYRDPTAWQDVMKFASRFLCQGGFLFQFDPLGDYAGFGDAEAMTAFVKGQSLGLELKLTHDPNESHGDRAMRILLWKKA